MKNWNVELAGVKFKNAIIAASGTPTINLHGLEECIKAGAGAICTKSMSFMPWTWKLPRPSHFFLDRLGDPVSIINYELGFWQPEEGVKFVKAIKPLADKEDTRVIANIAVEVFEVEKLKDLAKSLVDAGADMIEAACPCPILIPVETAETWYKENFFRMIETLKEAVNVPIYPKLFADVLDKEKIDFMEGAGVDAIHLLPPPLGITVDIENEKPYVPVYGLYWNRGWRGLGAYWTYAVSKMTNIPLMCSGGVLNGRDAIERFMLGASLVQICTPIIYYGYKRMTKIIEQVENFIEEKKHENIKDIVGIASPYVGDIQAFQKQVAEHQVPKESLTIKVNPEKCTGCRKCSVCLYGAIEMEDDLPQIDLNLCERCGVCESICPSGAITIRQAA